MNIPKTLFALVAAVALMLGVAACGDDDESRAPADVEAPTDLSGSISIDGSSTVEPFAQAAAELISEGSPDLEITVGAAGTSGGFEKFCAGEIDISNASRAIEPEEEDLCKEGGVEYTEVQVANDGIVDRHQPRARDLVPDDRPARAALVRRHASPTTPSSATTPRPARRSPTPRSASTGPGTDSGTFDYFTEEINGEEGKSRKEYTPSEDDNVLVEGVSGDEGGLGYFGFSYYEQNADSLNLVSVDAGEGCVEPSAETIQSGEYAPLARPLFMYPSNEALANARGRRVHGVRRRQLQRDRRGRADRPDGRDAGRGGAVEPRQRARAPPSALEATAAKGAAPGGIPPLGVARRRWGEEVIRALLFLAAAISVLTTIGIVFALVEESVSFFGEVGTRFFTDSDWTPLFSGSRVRDLAASQRHLPDHRDRDPGRDPARARHRDLPLRVRVRRACAGSSSRSSRSWSACRRSSSATSR